MKDFDFLPFYKLHDWILRECGASTDACLIAIIYSFQENGKPCTLSYSDFQAILQVSRPNTINRIRNLIESGYISVKKDSTRGNVYTVNRNAFTSNENDTSTNITSIENDTSASIENDTSTSNASDTSTSIENDTQIDIIENKKRIKKREGSGKAAAARPHGTYQNIFLTDAELAELQSEYPETWQSSLDGMSMHMQATGCKYKDTFARLRKWCREDAAKSAASSKPKPEKKAGMSSFDLPDLEAAIDF